MRRAPNASATGLSVFSLSVLSLKAYGLRLLGLSALLLALGAGTAAHAQLRPVEVGAEIRAAGGTTGDLPFWLAANRYGTVDPESANLGLRLHAHRPFAGTGRVDYAFGVDLLGRASERSTLHAHQLYGQLRVRPFEVTAGLKRHTSGLVDSVLSMGSTTRSANAAPIPRLSVAFPEYRSIPGTDGYLAIRGYFAHGWLPTDRYVRSAYLHEKYAYLRVFPERMPIQLHGGFIHNVIWGGTHPTLGSLPQGLDEYLRVVTGQPGDPANAPDQDVAGTLGNTTAAYDFAVTLQTDLVHLQAYRQFYLEDRPGLAFRNVWDGLWGLSLHRPGSDHLVSHLLWEHLRMTRQGARFSAGEARGADNYYNNGIYRGGWTYRGRTLGSPLLFADGIRPGVVNNLVVAHHVGLAGRLHPEVRYRLLGTYSRNYGARLICVDLDCTQRTSGRTPRRDQYAFLVTLSGTLSAPYGLRYETTLALDTGELYDTRLGGGLTLSWTGALGR
jgi:hypothetical protein